jgi:hypothetical protein
MSEDRKKILEMLADGKINVSEAEKLLEAVADKSGFESGTGITADKKLPKYLVVKVTSNEESGKPKNVNVRVPFQILRAGIKLTTVIPPVAKTKINEALSEKGINFDIDSIKPENLQEIVDAMKDMTIDVDGGKETVRVYCE